MFALDKERVATYFHGSGTWGGIGQNAFNLSSGNTTVFTNQSEYDWGAEFGLAFASPKFVFRVGIQAVAPHLLSGIAGADSSGNVLMNLTSTVTSYGPVAYVEMGLSADSNSRWSLILGGGVQTVTVNNNYTLTVPGQTAYPKVSSAFVEEGQTYAYMGDIGTSYEFLMVDSVTMILDAGYRYLYASGFKEDRSANTFLGSVNSGDPMVNSDGSNRTINLGGPWVGLGLRFYIK